DALAGLNASSITVPEIILTVTSTVDGERQEGVLTFTNLLLEDVVDGVAATASLESSSFDVQDGHAEMGSTSATHFNIGGILGIYGLVEAGGSTEMETLYADSLMQGGSFEAEDVSCEFGPVSGAEVRGRPIETSFVEILTLAQQMEADP